MLYRGVLAAEFAFVFAPMQISFLFTRLLVKEETEKKEAQHNDDDNDDDIIIKQSNNNTKVVCASCVFVRAK